MQRCSKKSGVFVFFSKTEMDSADQTELLIRPLGNYKGWINGCGGIQFKISFYSLVNDKQITSFSLSPGVKLDYVKNQNKRERDEKYRRKVQFFYILKLVTIHFSCTGFSCNTVFHLDSQECFVNWRSSPILTSAQG